MVYPFRPSFSNDRIFLAVRLTKIETLSEGQAFLFSARSEEMEAALNVFVPVCVLFY